MPVCRFAGSGAVPAIIIAGSVAICHLSQCCVSQQRGYPCARPTSQPAPLVVLLGETSLLLAALRSHHPKLPPTATTELFLILPYLHLAHQLLARPTLLHPILPNNPS